MPEAGDAAYPPPMSDPYAPGGFNPYQAPSAAADAFGAAIQPNATNYWREGDLLVVNKGATVPPEVCIATGRAGDGQLIRKTLQWAHPAVAIAILFNVIIYIILYLVMRKTGEIGYGFSTAFRNRRRNGILLAILGPVACTFLTIVGFDNRGLEWLGAIAAIGIIATLIVGIIMAQPFRIQKIDEHRVYLKVKPEVFSALGL